MPDSGRVWRDQSLIESPMVILTQSESVGRVVISRLGKRNEMRCINKSEFVLR